MPARPFNVGILTPGPQQKRIPTLKGRAGPITSQRGPTCRSHDHHIENGLEFQKNIGWAGRRTLPTQSKHVRKHHIQVATHACPDAPADRKATEGTCCQELQPPPSPCTNKAAQPHYAPKTVIAIRARRGCPAAVVALRGQTAASL